jgi:hypothetical protein
MEQLGVAGTCAQAAGDSENSRRHSRLENLGVGVVVQHASQHLDQTIRDLVDESVQNVRASAQLVTILASGVIAPGQADLKVRLYESLLVGPPEGGPHD